MTSLFSVITNMSEIVTVGKISIFEEKIRMFINFFFFTKSKGSASSTIEFHQRRKDLRICHPQVY